MLGNRELGSVRFLLYSGEGSEGTAGVGTLVNKRLVGTTIKAGYVD